MKTVNLIDAFVPSADRQPPTGDRALRAARPRAKGEKRDTPPGRYGRVSERFKAERDLPYKPFSLDLATAQSQTDPLKVTGRFNTVTVLNITAGATVYIRLNDRGNGRIPVKAPVTIAHAVERIFLDWGAVAGATADLVLGWELD